MAERGRGAPPPQRGHLRGSGRPRAESSGGLAAGWRQGGGGAAAAGAPPHLYFSGVFWLPAVHARAPEVARTKPHLKGIGFLELLGSTTRNADCQSGVPPAALIKEKRKKLPGPLFENTAGCPAAHSAPDCQPASCQFFSRLFKRVHKVVLHFTVLLVLFGAAAYKGEHTALLACSLLSELSTVFYLLAKIMVGSPD